MCPKIENIWIEHCNPKHEFNEGSPLAIRVDFDNDRHYRASVQMPCGQQQVFDALQRLAHCIVRDSELTANDGSEPR